MANVKGPTGGGNIYTSFQQSIVTQNNFLTQQQQLDHPGFWRRAYEDIPIIGYNAEHQRMDQIDALKNAQQLIEQIRESIANAIEGAFGTAAAPTA